MMSSTRKALLTLAALASLWLAAPAMAHQSSDSYLTLAADGATVTGHWDIALRDLDAVLALDADGDGLLTWGEIRRREPEIAGYALSRLRLTSGAEPCALHSNRLLLDRHTDGAYAVLELEAACASAVKSLQVEYHLFADVDAGHRGLLDVSLGGAVQTAVLGPAAVRAEFSAGVSRWAAFRDYLHTGVEHIWHGYDHILFLLSLLLPAVLMRRNQQWRPQAALQPAFLEVCKVVTAFTLAHSITLSLATLDIVRLPARVSESAIALSIVLAALNNVVPVVQARRWTVAFAFGLLHGFGFANVLTDLGLPPGTLALALVGFNLGVEAGQLAIVSAFLPMAYLLRNTLVYRRLVFSGGSLAIAVVGALWLIERAFNLRFLPVH
jgi:hypothetical protein